MANWYTDGIPVSVPPVDVSALTNTDVLVISVLAVVMIVAMVGTILAFVQHERSGSQLDKLVRTAESDSPYRHTKVKNLDKALRFDFLHFERSKDFVQAWFAALVVATLALLFFTGNALSHSPQQEKENQATQEAIHKRITAVTKAHIPSSEISKLPTGSSQGPTAIIIDGNNDGTPSSCAVRTGLSQGSKLVVFLECDDEVLEQEFPDVEQ